MNAIRVLARRVAPSLEPSPFVFDSIRSMSTSSLYDAGFIARLPARRSRSGLAAGLAVPGDSPATTTTTTVEASSSRRTRIGFRFDSSAAILLGSAASEACATSPSSSSSMGFFGSAASNACATTPPSSWATALGSAASEACASSPFSSSSAGFLGSAASNATPLSSWATPLGFSAARIACTTAPSTTTSSMGFRYSFSSTSPSIASGYSAECLRHRAPAPPYGRAFGTPFSTRRFSTSSSSSRDSTAPIINQEQNNSPLETESTKATITYVHGMFDDINEAQWTPFEYSSVNVPMTKVKLVGDRQDKEYVILTEVGGKQLFASLLLLIEKIKEHGYSFCRLTLSQLRVDKYGQFVISDGTLLEKCSKRNVSESHVRSAGIFEDIIRHSCGSSVDLPLGFRDLLRALRNKRTPHGYFLLVHPSLMPLHTHSQAYLDVYDFVENILPDGKAAVVISVLSKSAVNFWAQILEGNDLLQEWFRHESCTRYDVKNPWHMFRYLRNVHSHSLEYQGTLRHSKHDLRLLVECNFGIVMSTLYWVLWREKVLPGIESETYFCLPGMACCPEPGFCLRRKLRFMVMSKEVAEILGVPKKSS